MAPKSTNTINGLAHEIHENAKMKGFYEVPVNIPEKLILIVTEVAEACEANRKDDSMDPSIDLDSLVLVIYLL